jgi:hypothetical protein
MEKPTSEEWKAIMDYIQENIPYPVLIPEHLGEYMIDHFTNCLPPLLWNSHAVLCSEPYDHDGARGFARYIGFYKNKEGYHGVITTIDEFKKLS